MEVPKPSIRKTSTWPSLLPPPGELTTICRLDNIDLACTDQPIIRRKGVFECRTNTADDWCRACAGHGTINDTVVRQLVHEPFGHRPTTLHIRLRGYKCDECGRVWPQYTTAAAPPRGKRSRTGDEWALRALVIDYDTVPVIVAKLANSYDNANSATSGEETQAHGHYLIGTPWRCAAARPLALAQFVNSYAYVYTICIRRSSSCDGDVDAGRGQGSRHVTLRAVSSGSRGAARADRAGHIPSGGCGCGGLGLDRGNGSSPECDDMFGLSTCSP